MDVNTSTEGGLVPTTGSSPQLVGGIILYIVYTIIGVLGIVGNSLVIYLMVRVPTLRSATNVLICNQSVIDLISSILFLVLYLLPSNSTLPTSAVAADILCKLWLSQWPLWGVSVCSTVNLVLLTMERYFAIIHPIKYRLRFTSKIAKRLAVIPWFVGPLHELASALVHVIDSDGTCRAVWPSVALQRTLGVVFFTGHYVVPVSFMVYVYTTIVFRLRGDWRSPPKRAAAKAAGRQPKSGISATNGVSNPAGPDAIDPDGLTTTAATTVRSAQIKTAIPSARSRQRIAASRSVLRTLVIVSVSYVICWGPNEVIYLLFNLGCYIEFGSVYHNLSVVCVLCNMFLNPIIYAFHYTELKKALRTHVLCSAVGEMHRPCCCVCTSRDGNGRGRRDRYEARNMHPTISAITPPSFRSATAATSCAASMTSLAGSNLIV